MRRANQVGRSVAIGLALVALVAGCQTGTVEPRIETGRADAAEGAISIETAEWTYSVALDGVMWLDATNTWHDGGRPECLEPGASREVEFAAVEVSVRGTTWRPVVWVSCQ
jgi:hypothetical protein